MSLTQERINKIANESALTVMRELGYPEEQFITAHVAQRIVNLSLSRIREEQKAAAWVVAPLGGPEGFVKTKQVFDKYGGFPLFTIPPVAPDCKELVEALEMALEWIDAVPMDTQLPAMPGFDRDYVDGVIAKHKASMGEK